jgi:hypothetical protein
VAVRLTPRTAARRSLTEATIREASQNRALLYDKAGEEHYNLISALHKSLRDSDPDAALYWMTRMLESGEDPLYIARRLVRFASEDVGNADPSALTLTLAARDAYHFLGTPEGELALAQATIYLALAPKSNAVYVAYDEARDDVRERPAEPVPLHIRNAPTRLMKDLRYGGGLPVRARRAGRARGPGASARLAPGSHLLPTIWTRARGGARTAPGRVAPLARGAARIPRHDGASGHWRHLAAVLSASARREYAGSLGCPC